MPIQVRCETCGRQNRVRDGEDLTRARCGSCHARLLNTGPERGWAEEAQADAPVDSSETWIESVTGMEFVWMTGGVFKMGDVFGDGHADELPVHEVELDGFWLGRYPVTQTQWIHVMGKNPSFFDEDGRNPVELVSWNDARSFVAKFNELAGVNPPFRLPTEAEWEYACRSGGRREVYAGGGPVEEVAWFSENSDQRTRPVGGKRPNGSGLFDMCGNVWEWCEDLYDPEGYRMHARCNPSVGAAGGAGDDLPRVRRGGSWFSTSRMVRSTYRANCPAALAMFDFGLRIARSG